ncbi:hypothetical protein TEA_009913 [Camellia sinensis var. sinensis]|uniref:Uncharacterized protein n=1 Tax=Camellia sinensis var. sinensis TaxID=542762 RepID=A0A4S4DGJ3_CAMSN|nr:hypothetical protein TEA_009913 [Camellia sinensis var. sinensis]
MIISKVHRKIWFNQKRRPFIDVQMSWQQIRAQGNAVAVGATVYDSMVAEDRVDADLLSELDAGRPEAMDRRVQRDYPILEALPAIEDAIARELSEFSNFSGEEYSLDERAERFIERLYHEEKKM